MQTNICWFKYEFVIICIEKKCFFFFFQKWGICVQQKQLLTAPPQGHFQIQPPQIS